MELRLAADGEATTPIRVRSRRPLAASGATGRAFCFLLVHPGVLVATTFATGLAALFAGWTGVSLVVVASALLCLALAPSRAVQAVAERQRLQQRRQARARRRELRLGARMVEQRVRLEQLTGVVEGLEEGPSFLDLGSLDLQALLDRYVDVQLTVARLREVAGEGEPTCSLAGLDVPQAPSEALALYRRLCAERECHRDECRRRVVALDLQLRSIEELVLLIGQVVRAGEDSDAPGETHAEIDRRLLILDAVQQTRELRPSA
jgi:hypothetical protein